MSDTATTGTTSTTTTTAAVNLVATTAPLLSGPLRDCALSRPPAFDACNAGGIAAIQALSRYYNGYDRDDNDGGGGGGILTTTTTTATNASNATAIATNTTNTTTNTSSTDVQQQQQSLRKQQPVLIIPMGDYKSSLTSLSRFRYGVNVMMFFRELRWRVWTVPPYTLWPNRLSEHSLSDVYETLLVEEAPSYGSGTATTTATATTTTTLAGSRSGAILVSNVRTSPSERAHPFVKGVHLDDETQLAVLYLSKERLENTVPQIEATANLLRYVDGYNAARGCASQTQLQMQLQQQQQQQRQSQPLANNTPSSAEPPEAVSMDGTPTSYAAFRDVPFSTYYRDSNPYNATDAATNSAGSDGREQPPGPPPPLLAAKRPGTICYVPVVVFDDKNRSKLEPYLDLFRANPGSNRRRRRRNREGAVPDGLEQGIDERPLLRPFLIADVWGHYVKDPEEGDGEKEDRPSYHIEKLDGTNATTAATIDTTWFVSYLEIGDSYKQLRITLAPNNTHIQNVTLITHDLTVLPDEIVSSQQYQQDLDNLNQYAREAYYTPLRVEPGVRTEAMPPATSVVDEETRKGDADGGGDKDNGGAFGWVGNGKAGTKFTDDARYRHCYVGECPIGDLFADALRWYTPGTDVALLPSFVFDGPGWRAGEIRYLELHENVPYDVQRCGGTVTGLSLLRVVRYALAQTSFDPFDENAQSGGALLQLSGMRVAYNREMEQFQDRLLGVDVWDETTRTYVPLQPSKLYTFVSSTHICNTFIGFPSLLSPERLVLEGEVPAEQLSLQDLKDDVKTYLLSEFGNSSNDTSTAYRPQVYGRLVNDPSRVPDGTLDWTEPEDCIAGETYWDSTIFDCADCPTYQRVAFSKAASRLDGKSFDSNNLLQDDTYLVNGETFPVHVAPETLLLSDNIQLSFVKAEEPTLRATTAAVDGENVTYYLLPGEMLKVGIEFDPSKRIPGTDTSSLGFEVVGQFSPERDAALGLCPKRQMKYSIIAELSLFEDTNHLQNVAIFGYVSAALIILTSTFFAMWVWYNRKLRVVAAMQPVFLSELALGVSLIGAALVPMSIDDGVASERACDVACMLVPWLLFVGITIAVASLFSKLWRINRILNCPQTLRRVTVHEKDVILPSAILLGLVLVLMTTWTIASPLTWERFEQENEPWITYGRCVFPEDGTVGKAMLGSIATLCSLGFIATCWQAFEARSLSTEFSESKHLAIAIYSWVQLCVVGIPVVFLVEDDNSVAKYSVKVGLILAVCVSMLLVVFVPMLYIKYTSQDQPPHPPDVSNRRRMSGDGGSNISFSGSFRDVVAALSEQPDGADRRHPIELPEVGHRVRKKPLTPMPCIESVSERHSKVDSKIEIERHSMVDPKTDEERHSEVEPQVEDT